VAAYVYEFLVCRLLAKWFADQFAGPTAAQDQAWPPIKDRHSLIAAPTGSGKTVAAFLAAIDDLVRQGLEGRLNDTTEVVYVSPLKALSNDVHRKAAPSRAIRSSLSSKSTLP
jgi:ATP-dependent helicase Lhr and Lhr-like helicase